MASKRELRALITLAGRIDPSLQSAMLKASGESAKLAQNYNKATKSASKFGSIVKGVFFGNILTRAVTRLTSEIVEVGRVGLQTASDLKEVQNVVDVAFGESAQKINEWSKQALYAFGLSELQAKQFTGTLGAMLKSSGVSGDYLIKMSTDLSALAGDFASFYNLDHEAAFQKIRAGMSGETEPLKQLGINMSIANLEAYALSKGITTAYNDMDQASQVMLRYSYLLSVTKDAQGDFTRTQGEFANQTRLLKTNFQELASKIMSGAIPGLTKLQQMANNFITKIDPQTFSKIFLLIADTVAQISPLITDAFSMLTGTVGPALVDTLMQVLPVVIQIAQTALPLLSEGFMMLMEVIQPLMPDLLQIIQQILPIAAALIRILFAAIKPFIPVLLQIAESLLPPIMQILEALLPLLNALMPVITFLSELIAAGLGEAFQSIMPLVQFVSDSIAHLINVLTELINFITNIFTGNWEEAWQNIKNLFSMWWENIVNIFKNFANLGVNIINGFIKRINNFTGTIGDVLGINLRIPELQTFAAGGIATRPSIFGEAGPEMAIPLKRNQRSLDLLNQTADILGVPAGDNIQFTYAPVIYGGNAAEIEPLLQRHKEEVRLMIEDIMHGKRRMAYG